MRTILAQVSLKLLDIESTITIIITKYYYLGVTKIELWHLLQIIIYNITYQDPSLMREPTGKHISHLTNSTRKSEGSDKDLHQVNKKLSKKYLHTYFSSLTTTTLMCPLFTRAPFLPVLLVSVSSVALSPVFWCLNREIPIAIWSSWGLPPYTHTHMRQG